MLKIHCPVCKKTFIWNDDMPMQGKCLNPDCEGNYDVLFALKQSFNMPFVTAEKKILPCPSCGREISSGLTGCRHCSHITLGSKVFKKSCFFAAVCIFLIVLSLILKDLVK